MEQASLHFNPTNLSSGTPPTIFHSLRFKLYSELGPEIISHDICVVTDQKRILSREPLSEKSYLSEIRNPFRVDESNLNIAGYSDAGLILAKEFNGDAAAIVNFVSGRSVPLIHSPSLSLNLRGISDSGLTYGAVEHRRGEKTLSFARVWDTKGEEVFADSSPHSIVLCAEPYQRCWFGGERDQKAVVWKRDEVRELQSFDSVKPEVTSINGSGMSGGFVSDGSEVHAMVWKSDGEVLFEGSSFPGSSKTLRVLADSTYIIESISADSSRSYWIGRNKEIEPLNSKSFLGLTGLELVSIDGISPVGIMVVTMLEPQTLQQARCLVGPESTTNLSVS